MFAHSHYKKKEKKTTWEPRHSLPSLTVRHDLSWTIFEVFEKWTPKAQKRPLAYNFEYVFLTLTTCYVFFSFFFTRWQMALLFLGRHFFVGSFILVLLLNVVHLSSETRVGTRLFHCPPSGFSLLRNGSKSIAVLFNHTASLILELLHYPDGSSRNSSNVRQLVKLILICIKLRCFIKLINIDVAADNINKIQPIVGAGLLENKSRSYKRIQYRALAHFITLWYSPS